MCKAVQTGRLPPCYSGGWGMRIWKRRAIYLQVIGNEEKSFAGRM
jgi:hypothetical protein